MSENRDLTTGGSSLYSYLRQINSIPSLSKEEEFLLAKNYLEGKDLKAAEKLVRSHLKLVAKIALNYKNYGLPVQDLISEGNIGLMQAVKKYDPGLGFRLSTYAMWWIKAAVQEYILKSWSLVKIGTTSTQKRLFFSLNKIKNKLSAIYSRPISESDFPEIAKTLGVNVSEVSDMNLRISGSDLSLNDPVGRDDSAKTELIDFIRDPSPGQEVKLIESAEAKRKKALLAEAINSLGQRELEIFTERKLSDPASTLESLSLKYSISKERVRQIENRAFEKIKSFVLNHSAPEETKLIPIL